MAAVTNRVDLDWTNNYTDMSGRMSAESNLTMPFEGVDKTRALDDNKPEECNACLTCFTLVSVLL